jgi:hypothetical protein
MMNRFLLALILIFGVSGATAQTLGNPTFNSLTLINPLNAGSVSNTRPGTGAQTLTLSGWANNFFVNVMDFCSPTEVQNDITTCAGNALAYLASVGTTSYGRGELFFPAQYSPYKVLGTLTITSSDTNLVGEGPDATFLNCFSTTANCVQIGQSSGTQIHNSGIRNLSVNISGSVTTTGDNIAVINASQAVLDRVNEADCYICVEVTQNSNTTTIQNSNLFPQQSAAFAGVYFHDVATGATRSDILNLNNVNITGNYGQGTAILQDGQASTINMTAVATAGFVHGWWVRNSAESATYYPSFSNVFNFQPQDNSAEAVEIDAGSAWIISDSVIVNGPGAGSTTSHCAVLINPDIGYSNTNGVQISNSRIGNTGECGVSDAAKYTHLNNIMFAGVGLSNPYTYSAIQTQATALGAHYTNITGDATSSDAEYTVSIAAGAIDTQLIGIDGTNAHVHAVSDSGTYTSQCLIFDIEELGPAMCGIGSANPEVEGGLFSVRRDINAPVYITLHNNSEQANGEVAYLTTAGGANNYTYFGQTGSGYVGGLPASTFFFQPGPGAVGMLFDASQTNSSAGGPVTFKPYVKLSQAYSASGTAIPTCTSALLGSIAMVTDGTTTVGATYVGGGTITEPVFCTGANWIQMV